MSRLRRLLAVTLTIAASVSAQQADLLAEGIRQVKDGDFEQALVTLDIVARALAADSGKARDLAQAYLYMGVAYIGLGQETLARSRFEKALQSDPMLRPGPDEFPLKALRSFEAARLELAEKAKLQKEAGRKRGKGGLVLLGLGGAGAAGIALAVTTKERENRPPTAAIAISPEGQAIIGVTRMTLTANASDPEGEPLSYTWNLGDGTSASGPVVTHVYSQVGTFAVELTVADGLTSATARGQVTARGLRGIWRVVGQAFVGVTEFDFGGGSPSFFFDTRAGGVRLSTGSDPGLITDPRTIVMSFVDCRNNSCRCQAQACTCAFRFDGQADPTLQTIAGTLACRDQNLPCPSCGGRTQQLTLARQ